MGPRSVSEFCMLSLLLSLCRSSTFCATTDRKSTRLNSSHLVISYAVFCLKNTPPPPPPPPLLPPPPLPPPPADILLVVLHRAPLLSHPNLRLTLFPLLAIRLFHCRDSAGR